MAKTSSKLTKVAIQKNLKVTYEKMHYFILTWYRKVRSESFGIDLYVNTQEDFQRVIINGKEFKQADED